MSVSVFGILQDEELHLINTSCVLTDEHSSVELITLFSVPHIWLQPHYQQYVHFPEVMCLHLPATLYIAAVGGK